MSLSYVRSCFDRRNWYFDRKTFLFKFNPYTEKPSFSIKRSEITYFIAKVNLTVDGETSWPVSLYRTSL